MDDAGRGKAVYEAVLVAGDGGEIRLRVELAVTLRTAEAGDGPLAGGAAAVAGLLREAVRAFVESGGLDIR